LYGPISEPEGLGFLIELILLTPESEHSPVIGIEINADFMRAAQTGTTLFGQVLSLRSA
jgi:hypothetical protein